jgi:hypothetical protein
VKEKTKETILEILSNSSVPLRAFDIGYTIRIKYSNQNLHTQSKVIGALCGELVRDGLVAKETKSNGMAFYTLIRHITPPPLSLDAKNKNRF